MINIIGIVILILGFIAPYISDGRLPSIFFFWIGGVMCLNKGLLIKPETPWAKWARIGILTNIGMSAVTFATFSLIEGVILTTFEHWLSRIPYWLSMPATVVGEKLLPAPVTHRPDGSVLIHIGFFRTVVTDFLNVAIFASVSAAIGYLRQQRPWDKKS